VPALDDVLDLLRCPHCGAGLARADGVVRCGMGHSFDLARQGYLSLLAGDAAHRGDSADMVAARERFLAGGHFDRLAEALAAAVEAAGPPPRRIVDLGAGAGWYLAGLLDRLPAAAGLALDVSKPALRRAARAHPRMAAVACDVWQRLPLGDGVATAVLNVFAPRNPSETARVLRADGLAAVVTPVRHHLGELVEPLGLIGVEERKDERLAEQLAPDLEIVDTRRLEWRLSLDRSAARDAVEMGPSAFHVAPADLADRVAALPQLVEVSAAVTITLARSR
jgi:23S rRNA (guanine745-N1)-methyltransferase